jgi:hypothetical protein
MKGTKNNAKNKRRICAASLFNDHVYARSILPERRHRVHTVTVFTAPFSIMRIFLRFGLQTRLVWILEWLPEFPEMVPFLHT